MIATLSGKIAEKLGELVVIDINGVGYGLLMPAEDYANTPKDKEVKIYIYEHIRENIHDLYGFISTDRKGLFEQLLGVNGVGPKMALNILGIGTATELRSAIAGADTKFIQGAVGVGKRVAERVVIELKDKVGLLASTRADALLMGSEAGKQDDAVQALLSLGYDLPDAVSAMVGIDESLSTEERIKQALRNQS